MKDFGHYRRDRPKLGNTSSATKAKDAARNGAHAGAQTEIERLRLTVQKLRRHHLADAPSGWATIGSSPRRFPDYVLRLAVRIGLAKDEVPRIAVLTASKREPCGLRRRRQPRLERRPRRADAGSILTLQRTLLGELIIDRHHTP